VLLAAGLSALALAACGSGGGGAASSSTASSASSGAEAKAQGQSPLPGHPKIAAKPASRPGGSHAQGNRHGNSTRAGAAPTEGQGSQGAKPAAPRAARPPRALVRKAGKAAPFLVPTGDNSIPTYGSEASSSQQEAATASLAAYLQARASGEWGAACARMAAAVQKQLALLAGGSAAGCPAAYAKLAAKIPAAARANPLGGSLTALRVKGEQAFALFYGPGEQQYMMPMVEEGGGWRVNQIEAVPWPLGSSPQGN
jgi:hypothetical protein